MVAFRKSVFSCLVLACSLTSAGGIDVDTAAREKAKAIHEKIQRQPIIFFVAKGGPNACGPGCSEWIAAEGMIDHDAAQRFHDFLATLPRRDLPIFFNSTGGIAGQAMVLGTLLREHRMAVGVGRTLPEGCRQTIATEDACRRVINRRASTGRALPPEEPAASRAASMRSWAGPSGWWRATRNLASTHSVDFGWPRCKAPRPAPSMSTVF